MEPDLELHTAGTRTSSGGPPRIRPRAQPGRPPLGAQPAGPEAGGVPRLCQRREGILRQRPALQGHGGSLREVALGVPRELRGRDLGHRAGGGRPSREAPGGEQGLLPSGRRRRGGQAQRAFRLRRVPAAGHRQRARDRGQERDGLSLSGRGHPIAGRSEDAGRQWQGDDELLGRRAASVRHRARDRDGSRSTRRPACCRGRPIERARPRWSSP